MKKLLLSILGVLVGLVAILFFARNLIARKSVEYGAKKITGFPLTIGSIDLGLFSSKVDVHDLKLMNPSDFSEKTFVDMPRLYIDYRLGSMISGAPHVNDMLINIKQLVVVKNSKGETNAGKLKAVVSSGKSSSKYYVDTLRIHVGTVTIKDFSHPKPTERNVSLNVDATYKNISDSTDITRLVLLTVMSQVHLPDIGINTEDLKKNLGEVTNQAGQALQGAAGAVGGLFDNLKKNIEQPDKKK
jgi:uncharacterized protein involved in outer membrane biogenesis